MSSQWVAISTGQSAKILSSVTGSSTSMLPVEAPMNTLTPQVCSGPHRADLLEIVVGAAEVEGVVGPCPARGQQVLVRERRARGGVRDGVRHVHEAGDAAGHRRRGLGGDVALVGEARLAEMHLVVDHAGQQVPAAGVDDAVGLLAGQPEADPLDAAVADEDVALADRGLR